jgi:serine/threonine-protein kinase
MFQPESQSLRRIDAICGDFESSWQAGRHPQIEALVAQAEPDDRTPLLAELIALELELRLAAGEPAQLSEYQERFAGDQQAVAAAVARITAADAFQAPRSPRERFESTLEAERLQLGEPLGAGGMGVVLRAQDCWLKRNLAVKILAEPLQTRDQAVARFIREARICAWLQHPGIIPVYEMGWLGERPYFAMQLVAGRSLAELLAARHGPADDLPRWLKVFERVCETVAYAHARGVVHRDLKPANVMLGSFGEVYVIDWGLAKWLPEEDRHPGEGLHPGQDPHPGPLPEQDGDGEGPLPEGNGDGPLPEGEGGRSGASFLGVVAGTPGYMSPEQARGVTESIDRRSDVFALGAVLCEILTGAPPFADEDQAARLERARRGDLAEAYARLDACSADRELVVLARDCLALERAARPPDASQVWQRLNAFLRGVQEKLQRVELERAEAEARAQERRRRRRIILALAASLLLLVASLAAGTIWTVQREATRQRDESARREQIQRQLVETLDEIDQLYAGAPDDWREDPLRRTRIRELARRAETLAESPGAELAHLRRVRDLGDRIRAEDADGRLLDSLEAVRLQRAEVNPRTNKFASGRTRPLYRRAFADYGLDYEATEIPQAVARIKSRPPHVVEACVFALENWRSLYKTAVPPRQWIDTVLDGIDDNPWRCAVRKACRERAWPAVGDLLESVKDEPLSADVVNVVVFHLMDASQYDLALQLLQAAQPRHPGDFWINQYLAVAYFYRPEPELDESVRFFTVALAIRETAAGYFNLGLALGQLQRYAEAAQAFRSALRLQPDYVQACLALADVLERQSQTAEAAALRERAARLQNAGKKAKGMRG